MFINQLTEMQPLKQESEKDKVMNRLPTKIKWCFVNGGKKIFLYQVFPLCFILVGCHTATPETTFVAVTVSPTHTRSAIALEIATATVITSHTAIPVVQTPIPTTPSSTAMPVTPFPTSKNIPTVETTATSTSTPSFSLIPDGFLFYGLAGIDEEYQIYALQPGGTSRFVTKGQMLSGQAYSPDGTMLIVDTNDWSNPPLSPDKVFILNLETGEMVPLNLLAHPRSGVFWSADGNSLLYIDKYSEDAVNKLIMYDIASGENKILVELENILLTAGWAVDGETIAFVAEVDEQYDLFTINSHTLEWQQLSNDPEIETLVLWSPTAPQLLVGNVLDERSAFEGWPWGVESLYLVDSDSNNWEWLTNKFLTSVSLAWSPDGKQIAFSDAGLLCIKNLETMAETCPLADVAPYNDYFASFWEPPVWSPDGTWLAFLANNEVCDVLHFLELETKTVVPGDLGCDIVIWSPLAPIYWLPGNLPEFQP